MSVLQSIVNSNVTAINSDDEHIHLEFSNGATLDIFNQSSIAPADSDLIDSTLTNVTEEPNKITLTFNKHITLSIYLEDHAYTGPEALSHTDPTGRITVWN